MEEVRPMTDEEAKEWIKKYYGSHERYRQSSYADSVGDGFDETEAYLARREVEWEMRKRGTNDLVEVSRHKPELFRRYRKAVSIRVGNRVYP